MVNFRFFRFFRVSGKILSTLKNPVCIKVDIKLFHGTIQIVRQFNRRQFWSKLINLLYWKSWMHSIGPVFSQNEGPRSLFLEGVSYLVRLSVFEFTKKGPTDTVTNFIILTAVFQAVTGTWPCLSFRETERNREPTI